MVIEWCSSKYALFITMFFLPVPFHKDAEISYIGLLASKTTAHAVFQFLCEFVTDYRAT